MLERFTWFRQSAFRWEGEGRVVYLDPWGVTDPTPADVVLITHAHFDHFVPEDLERISTAQTRFVAPRDVAAELSGDVTPVAPGDAVEVGGVRIQAVPAYNIVASRLRAHPKENGWVGYVLELGGTVCYHAGDTDHLPELESIRGDVTFLPIAGPTMDPREAAALARAITPTVAVPMHFGYGVGSPALAEEFRAAAAPVPVEVMTPTNPFERR